MRGRQDEDKNLERLVVVMMLINYYGMFMYSLKWRWNNWIPAFIVGESAIMVIVFIGKYFNYDKRLFLQQKVTAESKEYNAKIAKLSDNEKVCKSIKSRAIWALNNRDGSDTEELYAIDLTTGKEIGRITNQNNSKGVKRTKSFDKKLAFETANDRRGTDWTGRTV